MKNNKKVFIASWFYFYGSFIALSMPIILLIWVILDSDNPTLVFGAKIFIYIFMPLTFVFGVIILGVTLIQWVTVDEEKIISRNLFKTMRKTKWEELTEIKKVSIGYTPFHPKFKWLVLVDLNGGEINLITPLNIKGKYIKIRNTKRSRNLIKKYRPDLTIENEERG